MVVPAATSIEVMLSKMACFVDFSMCSNRRLLSVALSAAQHSARSNNLKECMRNIAWAALLLSKLAALIAAHNTYALTPYDLALNMHSLTASANILSLSRNIRKYTR